MGVRILHTADWQLGKRFGFVPGDAGALIREQRLQTVERLRDLAVEREVDVALVAGDVFDMNTVEDGTLRRTLHILGATDVPWLLLPGNHDAALAESVWTRMQRIGLPANVHLLTKAAPFRVPDLPLVVLPAPLHKRHESTDLTAYFDEVETDPGLLRVGLAHGSVPERLPEQAEAHNPIAADRCDRAKLDYLALGDWHGTFQVGPRCWYAGTPEPDRFKDNDAGHALIVELDGVSSVPIIEKVPVGHYRWLRLSASLLGAADLQALEAQLTEVCAEPQRCLLSLHLRGAIDLGTQHRLSQLLETWQARVRHLQLDRHALDAIAEEGDFGRLATSGFLASAIDRLQVLASDPSAPEQRHASDALAILYREYQGSAS